MVKMSPLLRRLLLVCTLTSRAQTAPLKTLVLDSLVPDVIPVAPEALLSVSYTAAGVEVLEGNELLVSQVQLAPEVVWDASPDHYYALIMLDPDTATPAVRHWVVTNIRGSGLAGGDDLTSYRPSRPPVGSGLHRYVFLVYRQPGGLLEFIDSWAGDQEAPIGEWSLAEFVQDYSLEGPLAGNYYVAQLCFRMKNI